MENVFKRWISGLCFVATLVGAGPSFAAETTQLLPLGATKAQVIEAYGPPTGSSALGDLEILHYRNGQIRLRNGRVERVSLKAAPPREIPPPPAPAPAAGPGTVTPVADATNSLDHVWITRFEEAKRDAVRRNSVILAVFTASDATPSSRQFHREIVMHPEFVNAFRTHYVLLQVDFPVQAEQPAEIREQNEALRDRYGIGRYPALLILSASGEKIAEIDVADAVPGNAYRARLISAVSGAYELPVPAEPEPVPAPKQAPVVTPTQILVTPPEVTSGLMTARWLVTGALITGTLLAGTMLFILWLVIRKVNKPVALTRRSSMASRIDQAASGLPSFAELRAWPKPTLCNVISRLAETEGYVAEDQPVGSDKDLILKRPHNPVPQIIVCCVTGNAGVIPTRRIREMVGMLAAEDVPAGWFIAPMGFSADARAYAEQNNIRLIDGAGLLNRLSDLPIFALPKVLAAAQ